MVCYPCLKISTEGEQSILRLTGFFGSVALKSSSGFIRDQPEWSKGGFLYPAERSG